MAHRHATSSSRSYPFRKSEALDAASSGTCAEFVTRGRERALARAGQGTGRSGKLGEEVRRRQGGRGKEARKQGGEKRAASGSEG